MAALSSPQKKAASSASAFAASKPMAFRSVSRVAASREFGPAVVLEDDLERLDVADLLAEERVARQLRHAAVPAQISQVLGQRRVGARRRPGPGPP